MMDELKKNEFEIDNIYANCGSEGIVPKSSLEKYYELYKLSVKNPKLIYEKNFQAQLYTEMMNKLADYLNVNSEKLAFTQSTSLGISTVLEADIWSENDVVIIGKNEYIDAVIPFYVLKEKYGVEIVRADIENVMQTIKEKSDKNIRMVFFSQIEYNTGFEHDINRISSAIKSFNKDIITFIDGAQAAGHISVEINKDIDFYVFPLYKWLLGPVNTAVVYVGKKDISNLLPISSCSVGAKVKNERLELSNSVFKLENNAFDYKLCEIVNNNFNLYSQEGKEKIYEFTRSLAKRAVEGLKSVIPEIYSSNAMAFIPFNDSEYQEFMYKGLLKSNIICRKVSDTDNLIMALRFSFNIYNDAKEIDTIIEVIKKLADKYKRKRTD